MVNGTMLCELQKADHLEWKGDSSGKFSVRCAYEMGVPRSNAEVSWASQIWCNSAPPKVKCFGWLVALKRVKCADLLFKYNVIQDES